MKNYIILFTPEIDGNKLCSVITKEVCNTKSLELERCYDLIDCRLIDIHTVCDGNLLLIFDDEFLLNHIPIPNVMASQLDRCVLCGKVILCRTDNDGECVPFTEAEADLLISLLKRIQGNIVASLGKDDKNGEAIRAGS